MMDKFHIETERLVIRNWQDEDRELMHLINSDEQVMEFFPFRRNRKEADETLERIRASIDDKGYGFTALAMKQSNKAIGFANCQIQISRHPAFLTVWKSGGGWLQDIGETAMLRKPRRDF